MKPLYVWILDDEVIGVGDTRRTAFEDGQVNLENAVAMVEERGFAVEPPNAQDGYGVKVRFSHYPEDEDPRAVIADNLRPLDVQEEEGSEPDIIQELLETTGGGTLEDFEEDFGDDLREALGGNPAEDIEETPKEPPEADREGLQNPHENPGLTGDELDNEYPTPSEVQPDNHGGTASAPATPTEENESNAESGNNDRNPPDPS